MVRRQISPNPKEYGKLIGSKPPAENQGRVAIDKNQAEKFLLSLKLPQPSAAGAPSSAIRKSRACAYATREHGPDSR
jgi:hypothetical protein